MNSEKERKFVIITVTSRQGFYNLDFFVCTKRTYDGFALLGSLFILGCLYPTATFDKSKFPGGTRGAL